MTGMGLINPGLLQEHSLVLLSRLNCPTKNRLWIGWRLFPSGSITYVTPSVVDFRPTLMFNVPLLSSEPKSLR